MKKTPILLAIGVLLFGCASTKPTSTPTPIQNAPSDPYIHIIIPERTYTTTLRVGDPNKALPEIVFIEGIRLPFDITPADKDQCTPISLEILLKFYGKNISRREIAAKIFEAGKGTWNWYVPEYLEKQGGLLFWGFRDDTWDRKIARFYLAQQVPLIVQGKVRGRGHTAILIGYDDRRQIFYVADTQFSDKKLISEESYSSFSEWTKGFGIGVAVSRSKAREMEYHDAKTADYVEHYRGL